MGVCPHVKQGPASQLSASACAQGTTHNTAAMHACTWAADSSNKKEDTLVYEPCEFGGTSGVANANITRFVPSLQHTLQICVQSCMAYHGGAVVPKDSQSQQRKIERKHSL